MKQKDKLILSKEQQVELAKSLLSELWENPEFRTALKTLIAKILAELQEDVSAPPVEGDSDKKKFWKKVGQVAISIISFILPIVFKGRKKGVKK